MKTFAALTILSLGGLASAAPVYFSGSNSFYELFQTSALPWSEARDQAATHTFSGLKGRLVTINDTAENQFLVNTYGWQALTYKWVGGYQDFTSPAFKEPAGGWTWISGETMTYTNWAPGEPDNQGLVENYMMFGNLGDPAGSWNDAKSNDDGNTGYLVEYPVPEPASILVVALGFGLCLRNRRK